MSQIPIEFHEDSFMVEMKGEWSLQFDGSSGSQGWGAGVVLTSPDGQEIPLAFKLDFHCTNNEAEYEALLLGLVFALEAGATHLCIRGDSNLIIKQTNGEYALKEPALAPYRAAVQALIGKFDAVRYEHTKRSTNRYADALATLASKVPMRASDKSLDVKVIKKIIPCTALQLLEEDEETGDDWRIAVKTQLTQPNAASIATLKNFVRINGSLYFKGPEGVLSRCICPKQARLKLDKYHKIWCGEEGPPLYRRIQRAGYYWPSMAKDASQVQMHCPKCSELPDAKECNFVASAGDWRRPYIDYLKNNVLPTNSTDARLVKRKARKYLIHEDELYRVSFMGKPLRCIAPPETEQILTEVHAGECGEHQGARKLYYQLLDIGYYWPTMESDTSNFVKRCVACQQHGDAIHAPAVALHSLTTPWPFHTWAFDLIGPIHPPSKGCIWILAGTECFTKWVEASPLKKATGPTVASFIKENIICRFGIPKRILSDNGTPFVNSHVRQLLESYSIDHVKSTPYYPKGNGQAEATNKTLLKVLSRMVHDNHKEWHDKLPLALWAYRTSKRRPTQATPFSLVYGAEAVVPVEVLIPSARLAINANLEPDALRMIDLEALDERRDTAKSNLVNYQHKLGMAYDRLVRSRSFQVGDVVLRAAEHVRRGIPAPKFTPKWEGPFIIHEVHDSGYCKLLNPTNDKVTAPINFQYIKKFHV